MGGPLRILSANLWNGRASPEAFAQLVEATRADVVAVQETTPEQAQALRAVRPYGRIDPDRSHRGMGLALRAPARVRTIELPHRNAYVADLAPADWPELDAMAEILNVHVQAPHIRPFRRSMTRRRAQLGALERYLATTPVRRRALVGDLNSTPLWPVYRRLAAQLTDAARAHAQRTGRRPVQTWGPASWAPRVLRIDHALVGGFEVLDCRVLHVRGSDHSALLIEIEPIRLPDARLGAG